MATTYQAQWDCATCGEHGLLALTHSRCPGCGVARGATRTYLPDWDLVVREEDHRFAGSDARCCGTGWSAAAHHCGRCGEWLGLSSEVGLARLMSLASAVAAK